jgi:hypothetical protein
LAAGSAAVRTLFFIVQEFAGEGGFGTLFTQDTILFGSEFILPIGFGVIEVFHRIFTGVTDDT